MNDNEWWVRNIKRKDEQTIAKLRSILFNYLTRHFETYNSFIEDVIQDSLIAILNNIDNFRYESKFLSWCISISKNKMLSIIREEQHLVSDDILEFIGYNLSEDYQNLEYHVHKMLLAHEEDRVHSHVSIRGRVYKYRITERQWSVFKQREIFELETPEVARIFNITEQNVIRICSEVKAGIREYMEKEGLT